MARKVRTDLTLKECLAMVSKDNTNIQEISNEREKAADELKKFTEEKIKKN